jgi:hypothetical protein
LFIGKIEYPVGIDKFVAKINGQVADRRLGLIVGFDAVGSHQEQQVGSVSGGNVQCSDAAFDLGLNASSGHGQRRHRATVRVKDQAGPRAFDVDRLEALAALAKVGHQRVGMLVALTEHLKLAQSVFELGKLLCQAEPLFPAGLVLLVGLVQGHPPADQILAVLAEPALLLAQGLLKLAHAGLLLGQAEPGGCDLFLEGLELGIQRGLLAREERVQGLSLPLPILFLDRGQLPLSSIPCRRPLGGTFGRAFSCRLHRPLPRRDPRPSVNHHQQQDQRTHGAEQHRQERKGVDLQWLAPSLHDDDRK